jgi:hypothetical protein
MALVPATITTELLEHADGRPVAYIDATAVAIFTYQQPDGTYVIDVCTREEIAPGRLRLFLDGGALLRASPLPRLRKRWPTKRPDAERSASSPSQRQPTAVQP